MMNTTTSDGGVSDDTQPQDTEAVAEQTNDQAQATDDSQATSQADDQTQAAASDDQTKQSEAQALSSDASELKSWLDKKGLKINFDNPNEVKLAEMQLNAEKKMHESTQPKPLPVEPPEEIPTTGNETYDEIIGRQNRLEMTQYVRDWFDANPDAKDQRLQLQEIAAQRPWLQNMDDVYAHFLANPSREAELKQAGGREALTNLAHKQQAVPPSASATDATVYDSGAITPENVDELVAKNSQEWYNANHEAIRRAAFGNSRT